MKSGYFFGRNGIVGTVLYKVFEHADFSEMNSLLGKRVYKKKQHVLFFLLLHLSGSKFRNEGETKGNKLLTSTVKGSFFFSRKAFQIINLSTKLI